MNADATVVNFSFSGLSAIGVYKVENVVSVAATLSRPIFEKLAAQAQNLMNESVDFQVSQITFVLNNDTKGDVKIAVRAGFVDGEPILNDAITLRGRSKTQIVASNVHEKMLEKKGYVPIFLVLD
jgi:triacylglycerol esterase/lipase EstA (alpha/beta hydrolase family)